MVVETKSRDELFAELEESRRRRDRLQERLDRIIDITAGIIYILDTNGCFVFINNAVEEILHYAPNELLGKHFSVIMPPNEYRRVSRVFVLPKFTGKRTGDEAAPKLFDERRTGNRKTRNLEVQLLTKSQKEVRIMAGDVTGIIAVEGSYDARIMEESKDKAAAFMGSQGLIFDITKYKKAEQEKFEIQHRLLELQKMDALGRLAEGVAHDFNNKLGTILGCAEMIKQTHAGKVPELGSYVDPLISASKHAAELTGKLLLFSRNRPHHEEDVRVHDCVRNVVQLLRHTVDKRITIIQSLHRRSPLIRGDSSQVQSALLNIAINACDAMPDGGTITFETDVIAVTGEFRKKHTHAKECPGYVHLSVVDDGTGIDPAIRAHIFEPFFTTKTKGMNLGIGLTSVHTSVKALDGFIEVESVPGKGTRFDVYLPLLSLEADAGGGPPPDARVMKGTGRILVVDDEDSFLDISKRILEDLGYSAVTCGNGREAVDYFRTHHHDIDMAIIDVMMPELSGCDCFRELKKIDPGVKAIISTGYGLTNEIEAVLKEGAAGFIQKPFESAALSQILSRITISA
jgi:two-component system, cell cycle sensor histidine kinase and response regulator CckA